MNWSDLMPPLMLAIVWSLAVSMIYNRHHSDGG
jgi:hypothetical protein